MKKIHLLLMVTLALVLTACSAAPASSTPADRGAQFVQAYQKMEAAFPEMMEMPEDTILDFYGIAPEEYETAVFRLSVDNMLADEAVFIQAKDAANADHIEEMLNARLQAKAEEAESYSPEQYEIIHKCSVYRDDLCLAMIVNEAFEEKLDIFKKPCAEKACFRNHRVYGSALLWKSCLRIRRRGVLFRHRIFRRFADGRLEKVRKRKQRLHTT